jgi:PmbA protein
LSAFAQRRTTVNESVTDAIVQEAKRLSDAHEVYVRQTNSLTAKFDKGRFQIFERDDFTGASIRAVKGGRIGFATSTQPTKAAELVATAVRLAPYGSLHDYAFTPKLAPEYADVVDPKVSQVTPEMLAGMGSEAIGLLRELAPEAGFSGQFASSWGASHVVTSEGADAVRRGTNFSMFVGAEINSEGDFLSVYDGWSGNGMPAAGEAAKRVKSVAADFHIARKLVAIPAGTYRVLFSPRMMGEVLSPLMASVNGINVEKKTSRWVDSIGQQVLDPRITVTDDPSLPDGIESGAYDGEGMPARRRAIVEKGILRGFIHSRSTAARCGTEPTGNGRRGVETIARPGFHNIVMEAGDVSKADMVRQCENGLVIDSLIGSFTSNFLAGQLSGGIALGYLVKDGRRVGRVKNAAVNINLFEALNGARLLGLSREREWHGSMLVPGVLLDGVSVSAR